MQFNRFDIVTAWYLALSHCHMGQGSREYYRLSRITRYFRPGFGLSVETLNDNARAIYEAAVIRLLAQ